MNLFILLGGGAYVKKKKHKISHDMKIFFWGKSGGGFQNFWGAMASPLVPSMQKESTLLFSCMQFHSACSFVIKKKSPCSFVLETFYCLCIQSLDS